MSKKITYCPPIHECDACKEIIDAKCVKYNGSDLPDCEVSTGNNLQDIIAKLCNGGGGGTGGGCPQACVKLHRFSTQIGGSGFEEFSYSFFSCSPDISGCVKTYKIFDQLGYELYSGTLYGATTFAIGTINNGNSVGGLPIETAYKIVEYITCGQTCSTESLDMCFKVKEKRTTLGQGQDIQLKKTKYIVPSCNCCSVDLTGYNITLDPINCGQCIVIDLTTAYDSNGIKPANVVIASVSNGTVTGVDPDTLQVGFCADADFIGTAIIQFRFVDSYGNYLEKGIDTTHQVSIPVECPELPEIPT